ncbi:6-phosphogluconate dehydrogenase [Catalinimonas alkaloidigena]|uniref:6-phosphogluconate dehydrogenase, decarboxylating n=1 Tax=Catalinimonas alkaloidigena TaxID=1075417 RepID=A0A1G9LNF3_9BACT|nr:NADP-dependent phosphogluconate dehydrogenase [Catalinimonas alkaloidigena]SDL63456.1 6-phosphogluconate dehydrogenase [Catalinimonas alkaloidigena]
MESTNSASGTYDFGVIGLGVMGHSLILNIGDHGFSVVGYDTDSAKAQSLTDETGDQPIRGTASLEEFVDLLEKPRRILMMVPAGGPVDAVIKAISPLLDEGDLLLDGGNSHFPDTERRAKELAAKKLRFFGMGVSGGQEGARRGPSIMPGGDKEAYERVRPVLEAIAAKVKDEPCVAYMGSGAAGHYVKMVHNGIEYSIMQLISEAYDLMQRGLGLRPEELHEVFKAWDDDELQSFLIEITAAIFDQRLEDQPDSYLVDFILDSAKQKGTGKWTSQSALDLGVPTPNIDVAVTMRYLSALKPQRMEASETLLGPPSQFEEDRDSVIGEIRNALSFAFIVTFAQGMALLRAASDEYNYGTDLASVARIWRGGCIIRARLLEDISAAYTHQPDLPNLMMDDHLAKLLSQEQVDARNVVARAAYYGIPVPGLSVALAYYDAYRSARLPSNLIQAQRDYFGAHTYERTDLEGTFHTEWGD